MHHQIEDVDGPSQRAVFQHDEFFQGMGHRHHRRDQQENRDGYQNTIGDLIEKIEHGHSISIDERSGRVS